MLSTYNLNMLKLWITLSFILKAFSFFVNLKVGFACFFTFAGLLQAYKYDIFYPDNRWFPD